MPIRLHTIISGLGKRKCLLSFLSKDFRNLLPHCYFEFPFQSNTKRHWTFANRMEKKIAQDLKMISKGPNGNLQYIYFLVSFFFDRENRSRLSLIFFFGSTFLVLSDVFFVLFFFLLISLSPFQYLCFLFCLIFTSFFFSYCHHFLLLRSEFSDKDFSAFIHKIAQ